MFAQVAGFGNLLVRWPNLWSKKGLLCLDTILTWGEVTWSSITQDVSLEGAHVTGCVGSVKTHVANDNPSEGQLLCEGRAWRTISLVERLVGLNQVSPQ